MCGAAFGMLCSYVNFFLYFWSDPIENPEIWTVDHINGKRTDNRLENLRWTTGDENTLFMLWNRAELNKELTRIINKIGYEKTLEKLRTL